MMVGIINIGTKHSRQSKMTGLLSAAIIAGGLIIAAPAFADTDAAQMQAMKNKISAIEDELSQMTSGMANRSSSGDGLPMHGFMDVGFAANSQGNNVAANPNVANPKGFYEGRLSFYLTPHFNDNVKVLAEPNFEVSQSAGTVNVDIERLQIGYTFSDTATVWGGRFHTPYGYWNTAFHHGAQLQTSVLRPRFLDFEDSGGILPAHMVGLWGTGRTKAGKGKFTYDWYVGNGPKILGANSSVPAVIVNPLTDYQTGGLDPNIGGDNNHSAMVGLNLGYEFSGRMDGLRLAVHWLQGDVDAYDATPVVIHTTGLNMGGGSVVYLSNDWEVMGEYYGFNDKNKTSTDTTYNDNFKSRAGYFQAGKSFGELTPYVRFERTVLDQQDYYFNMQSNGQSYARQALGLRYNLNPKAALKLELLNSSFKQETGRTALGYRSLYAQYAIGF